MRCFTKEISLLVSEYILEFKKDDTFQFLLALMTAKLLAKFDWHYIVLNLLQYPIMILERHQQKIMCKNVMIHEIRKGRKEGMECEYDKYEHHITFYPYIPDKRMWKVHMHLSNTYQ